MSILFNADTSDGLKITSDNSGEILFQSAGVTKGGVNTTGLTGDGSQLTGIPATTNAIQKTAAIELDSAVSIFPIRKAK